VRKDPHIAKIEANWGSEENLHKFLEAQVAPLCQLVCGADASIPRVRLKPTWLARGLMGERSSAADYEPEDDDLPATIDVFPSLVHDERVLRTALAHELVHHWEHMDATHETNPTYPQEADELVSQRFKNAQRENAWRSGHSRRFIAKAAEASRKLDLPLSDMLFHSSTNKGA
jgi:hypothetical protein